MKKFSISILFFTMVSVTSINAALPFLIAPLLQGLFAYDIVTDIEDITDAIKDTLAESEKEDKCNKVYKNAKRDFDDKIVFSKKIVMIDEFSIAISNIEEQCQMEQFITLLSSAIEHKDNTCNILYRDMLSKYKYTLNKSSGLFIDDEEKLLNTYNEISKLPIQTCKNSQEFENLISSLNQKIDNHIHWFNIIVAILFSIVAGVSLLSYFIKEESRDTR